MSDRAVPTATVQVRHHVAPEDEARAEFYALLARLYAASPDAPLLAAIGASTLWDDDGINPLASSWNRLVLASRVMDAEAAEQEYTDIFVGVGKSEVNPHGSHWLSGFMMEKPLVELRGELAQLGLGRQPGVVMLEDHLGALFETMRILIAGQGDRRPAAPAVQQRFFDRQIAPWCFDCCNAVQQCSVANYYARVAELTSEFLAVERDSLAME
jgi:TorA maturation chaperone TorD